MEKIHVILDTDTYNECDDQFALTYLIKHQDIFDIEAITIAPYSHHTIYISAPDSQGLSYNEAKKICKYFKYDEEKVYKGSSNYLISGYSEDNDAVNKIIEIAHKNDKTYILGIAAPTNIALAIKKDPSIINKIEIIWLGGHKLGYENNVEYNFKQDLEAVKTMFNSGVPLTVLPAKGVVSKLNININVLKENLANINDLYDYLIERFHDDGYHPIREERPIWDIAVIAYMVNKNWFEETKISCPDILEDTSYQFTKKKNKVTFVTDLDKDKIYNDLFTRYKM
ncbi:MAG: nucleoside hydrolase [Bacilli bacterium]|nr:nucleoside hydrolase [Bacilli bacterium]